MLRSFKYRLMPRIDQSKLIDKHIGCCRFIYNLALEVKNNAYVSHRKNIGQFELMRQLTDLKNEYSWLREVDSQCLQQSIKNLDKAFTNFFKGYSSFPKFKKKTQCNSFLNPHGSRVKIKYGKLFQPKFLSGIPIIIDRAFEGEIRNTTISRTPTGKYFVSILVETGIQLPTKQNILEYSSIGIDLGIKSFIITSDGLKVDNPRHLQISLSKLKYLQRQHSKKKKGSNNRKKTQLKVALCHELITNQRNDFLNKLSTQLVNSHDTLCFETLKIENMIKNHKLAQSISSASWGNFVEMCKYKADWYGKNILQIPTFQPSTKICSNCDNINSTLTLSDREWTCASCGTSHDRDVNAAINIKKYALKNCGGVHREKSMELPTLVGVMK